MGIKKQTLNNELEDEIVTTIFKFMALIRGKKTDSSASELTLAQLHCVIAINDTSPSMAEIANELELSMPTITVTIDKLVKLNYVVRKTDPSDRRVVRVTLTTQGKKITQKMRDQKAEIIKSAISKLSVSDRKKTREVMVSLLGALEEK
ncbi:MAG: MarR family transcriptional regulator [Acidimicrobiia bacterium]|nr:MarR family transcriptional regulator [Acidimicrobiia bacterium]